MKNKIKNLVPYILTVLAITGVWFFKSGFLFFTDFVWGKQIILDWQSSWFAFYALIKFLSIFLSIAFLQKLFISLVFLVVLLGGKKLIEEVFFLFEENADSRQSHLLVFVLSLFVLFNPFVYDRVMYGQFGVVLALGFLCLALGNFLRYLKNSNKKNVVWFGIFSGLMFMFSAHFSFLLALSIILITAPFAIKKELNWKNLVVCLVVAIVICLAININWLIGLANPDSSLNGFIKTGISEKDLAAFQTAGKTKRETIVNVLMMSGFWGKDQFRYNDLTDFKENWGRSFFLLLLIILWGVWIGLKNKKTRIFSVCLIVLFIISGILAVGIKTPIAKEITQFLFNHLPFYQGLRESQKWVAVISIVYLIFLSLGIKNLKDKKLIKENKIIGGLVLGGIIIMQTPLLLFGLNGQVGPTKYPADWYEVDNLIVQDQKLSYQNEKCDAKIIFLPWHLYMSFNWLGHIIANPAENFFSCPTISSTAMEWGGIYDNSMDKQSSSISRWLNSKGSFLIDDKIGAKYIVLAKELDWQSYLWISKLPNVMLIRETPTLRVYKINE